MTAADTRSALPPIGQHRRQLQGVPASPGVARGRWTRIERPPLPAPMRIRPDQQDAEVRRLQDAAAAVAKASTALAGRVHEAGHEGEAEIFAAHAAIAEDPELLDDAARRIRGEATDGIGAIAAAARTVADSLAALDDELLRSRATDVLDVAENIARRLAGFGSADAGLHEAAIVIGRDLPPSLTASLPRDRLLGIALEGSSPTAHAAILARAYGIASVVGVPDLLAVLEAAGSDVELLMDGSTGVVVVDPDPSDLARFAQRDADVRAGRERDAAEATQPAATRDGALVTLLANIGAPSESTDAVRLGAAGVGLFRTEFLFLERSRPPSEDEQAEAYSSVARAFAPHAITIRLLDVGGDKPIPYLQRAPEANPFLGVRALRLARHEPDLFITQLRACYRAAIHGRVKVMAPMVADAADVDILLDLDARARRELVKRGDAIGEMELGVMLEIPSAILVADSYFSRIRFASIGTNDLVQYTLAVDRGNPNLERYRDALHPSVLRLIRYAVEAAARAGIELSVCGEMAGDPVEALALIGLGVRSLSMGPSNLAAVRRAIRGVDLETVSSAALVSQTAVSPAEVRSRFAAITQRGES